jgi:hypothetical protein
LAPSQRWSTERGRRHKKLTDWARQAILQTKRWLAKRTIVIVADSSFAALELIASVRQHVCFVTRLRLDANLFEAAPTRRSGRRGRPRKKGRQLPKLSKILTNSATRWTKIVMSEWYGDERCSLNIVTGTAIWYHSGLPPVPIRWVLVRDPSGEREPQAFLCTDLNATPARILGWFVQRWSMETTLQETREHLGVETQRQWSDLAILRTTPALLGMFSLITIWANTLSASSRCIRPRDAAWYVKSELTFSDAIAAVRRVLWAHSNFSMSGKPRDVVEIPRPLFERLTETLCYAT